MSTAEEKKAIIFERMSKREEEREATKEQRRTGWGIDSDKREMLVKFNEELRVEGEALLSRLDETKLETMTLLEQKNVFSEVMDGIEVLSQRLSESTMYMPAYDIGQSREFIQSIAARLTDIREQLQPKKKFAFAGRRKKTAPKPTAVTKVSEVDKLRPVENLGDYGAAERVGEEILLPETSGKDLFLSQLRDCRVQLSGGGMAMRVDRLENCVVIIAPMSGSIFIDNCHDCVFVVACQQLRIHTTLRTHFYIHVTSKAIIEYCSELQFAPYTIRASEEELDRLFEAAQLARHTNNWDQVDDFCHLAVDVKSTNWNILVEENRKEWSL